MATYPNNVLVKGDVINEVDVVDQNDHNILKGEIIALQTYVGTSPQGGFTDFASRVNRLINGTGVVVNSSGFPSDTTPMRLFYRTDSETLYIRRADNTAWQTVGSSFSNVIYSWCGCDDASNDNNSGHGIYYGTATAPTVFGTGGAVSGNQFYWTGSTVGTYTLIRTKFNKISGITTIKAFSRVSSVNGVKTFYDIGAGTVVGTTNAISSSPFIWSSTFFDVSALTNGTFYDLLIKLSNEGAGGNTFLSSVIIYGA